MSDVAADLHTPPVAERGFLEGQGDAGPGEQLLTSKDSSAATRCAPARVSHGHHGVGRRAQAHEIITSVFSWFTEGFDMPDLRRPATFSQTAHCRASPYAR